MKKVWRVAGLAGAILSLALWIALGANRGWTKNTHTRWVKDPITEIDSPSVEKRFRPGVDLLAAAMFVSFVLFSISFVVREKKTLTPTP